MIKELLFVFKKDQPLMCRIFGHKLKEIKRQGCYNVGYCKRCGRIGKLDKKVPRMEYCRSRLQYD